MPSKDALQPNLRSPEDQRFRMAGRETFGDTPQKRVRAMVLTGLTGILAAEAFTVAAQGEPGGVDQEEPAATSTPETQTTEIDSFLQENLNTPFAELPENIQNYLLSTPYHNLSVDGQAYASAHFGEILVARRENSTPTPAPEADGIEIAVAPAPTPGETAVAMVSLDRSRFVEASQFERFPRTIHYTNPLTQQEVRLTVDPERLSQIRTVNGTPLPLGVYDEQHPLPIDPRMFEGFQEWSGGDLRPAYIVGVLTEVNGAQENNTQNFYVNPEIVVSIPLPASRDYFPVNIFMTTVGGRFGAIDHAGSLVPFPADILDNMGRIPYQSNGIDHITYSNEENWIAFPTSEGTSVVRVGDPIIVRVVFNLDVYSPSYRQSFIVSSSGRTPEQVVADLYDNNPANDGQWYQESSALATIFTPYDEIAQR